VKALTLRVLLVVLALTLAAESAQAQRRARRRAAAAAVGPRFGPHLGYNFDVDELVLGAQFSWPMTPRVELYPTFDYYFVDPGSLWSLNFDVKIRPPTRYGAFYFGGGLNYSRASAGGSSGSDTGLNLLAGLEGRRGRTVPYVEARLVLGGLDAFQIVGGFSWR